MQISNPSTSAQSDRSLLEKRLWIEHLVSEAASLESEIAQATDVIHGLTQAPKTLSPKYLYDDRGSVLFEQICEVPEYYPTRTETTILQNCTSEIARLTGPCELVELGSGSSTKTRILLDAYQSLDHPLRYLPIDISGGILEKSAYELLEDYPSLQVHGLVSTYEQALAQLNPSPLPTRMISFLGSTLGNLSPVESDQFFADITTALQPGEYFLLGIDLQKPPQILEAAYNDAQGVTAAFNLNLLQHLNRRFQGNFNLQQFEHWAFYNQQEHRIEMHLRSLRSQTVQLRSLDLTVEFAAGETLRTEISRKFNLDQMQAYLKSQGLTTLKVWTDSHPWFAVLLCQVEANS
ncbi:dimethylhistidine N-methyltransferase [Lyngbya aestuarii BL J]|uniref:Dimethylhistidine N-methyltransferase n=1 Tax=Lyngbya aestuarii BL J TaxID=1348334 RepID=U7QSB5_9CYAN|nr:L-histidine N(alpha)-methyltransferase [Lyngbya aestuarii]ERT09985.1 dimethylhistidine N-methyltransferase [Lyngbya aestuarii BL J]